MMRRKRLLGVLLVVAVVAAGVYFIYFMRRNWEHALANANDFKLLSIDPDHNSGGDSPRIMGFKILGETEVTFPSERAAIVGEFKKAVANFDNVVASCFDPRHDIRFVFNGKTYDILICFECRSYVVLCDGKHLSGGGVKGTPVVMNEILKKANVPLPKQPRE